MTMLALHTSNARLQVAFRSKRTALLTAVDCSQRLFHRIHIDVWMQRLLSETTVSCKQEKCPSSTRL